MYTADADEMKLFCRVAIGEVCGGGGRGLVGAKPPKRCVAEVIKTAKR